MTANIDKKNRPAQTFARPVLRNTDRRLHRRSNAMVRSLYERMRALEAEGKSRKQIALALDLAPAQVTRRLGPKRRWRHRRVPRETDSQKLSLANESDSAHKPPHEQE